MIYKVKISLPAYIYKRMYTPPKILGAHIILTFFIIVACLALFAYKFSDFYAHAKPDIHNYHKKVFERSMSAYKAQLTIPNNHKNFDLIATSKTIKKVFNFPSSDGCKKLWDLVFYSGTDDEKLNKKILKSDHITFEVVTNKTCRFFLKNNNEMPYFFDYALNI